MGRLLLPIPITLIPIQATCRERLWRGVRELRWVPPRGALGAVIGTIAIGTAATSTSTTTIISIRTTISTATSAARDKVIGSTIRNTAEMLRMETGKQPISLAVRGLEIVPAVRVASVVPEEPVARAALVVLESPVARVALVVPENPVAPVVPENPVVPAARVVSESPAVPVALERGQAVAELQHAPVVAVPVLGHRRVQQAIPL